MTTPPTRRWALFFCALHFCANLQLFAGMRYQLRLSLKCTFPLLIVVLVFASSSIGFADESLFKRENEIIYGRKHGLAMTLDIFQPLAKRNNRGIVLRCHCQPLHNPLS